MKRNTKTIHSEMKDKDAEIDLHKSNKFAYMVDVYGPGGMERIKVIKQNF